MIINSEVKELLSNNPVHAWFFWITPKIRATGQQQSFGLWTGLYDINVSVNGMGRSYQAGGNLLSIGDLIYDRGLNVRTQQIVLSGLAPEAIDIVKEKDPTLAKCDLYLAVFDPVTKAPTYFISAFEGIVDDIAINANPNGSLTMDFTLVSSIRAGTKKLATKKSDASQRLRDADDAGRIYADISGKVSVSWGTKGGEVENYIPKLGNMHNKFKGHFLGGIL